MPRRRTSPTGVSPDGADAERRGIARGFWESGQRLLLLESEIAIDCPVRLLHGERDTDVPLETAFRTMRALRSGDVQLNVLKGGGHRLSEPLEIDAILRTVANLMSIPWSLPLDPSPRRRCRNRRSCRTCACPDIVTPDALVCRALASQKAGDSGAAAQGFEEAAKASGDKDPKTARMYAAAGNLWIEANQPGKAALDLDKALALPGLEAEQRGEALLDRARAAEAQNDLITARAKLKEAGATISDDPFYWYFSAALAIREGDGANAKAAIGKALTLAPSDPAILFEAGHVARRPATMRRRAATGCGRRAATPTGRSARPPPRQLKCSA